MFKAKMMPVARASLPIRRPRGECFMAFSDPDMLDRFWLHAAGDAYVEEGRTLTWTIRPDTAPVAVTCHEVRPDCLMRLKMSNGVSVMLTFDLLPEGGTMVHYCECGLGAGASAADVAEANQAAAQMLSRLKDILEPQADRRPQDRPRLPAAA